MIIGVDYRDMFDSAKATRLKRDTEMILAELNLLLNMEKYSLFFGNNMGLDCEKYLNLTNKTAIFNLVKSEIEGLFIKYKRAIINKIEISFEDESSSLVVNLYVSTSRSGYNSFLIPIRISN